MSAQRLSPRTQNERVSFVIRLATALDCDPTEMQADRIVRWMSRRAWTGSTAHTYWSHLRSWQTWLVKHGYRTDNPIDLIPAPKRPTAAPRPISTEQLARILNACGRRRARAMVLLGALAGLRAHEIAKFRGDDIDLDQRLLWVTGKGNVTASIPLHPILIELAREMPRRGYWFTTYVGPDANSQPVQPQAVGQAVSAAMLRAGVPGTCHQLRHWFGTQLMTEGADLRTVQTLLRHASLSTTERYTKVTDDRRAEAVTALRIAA